MRALFYIFSCSLISWKNLSLFLLIFIKNLLRSDLNKTDIYEKEFCKYRLKVTFNDILGLTSFHENNCVFIMLTLTDFSNQNFKV